MPCGIPVRSSLEVLEVRLEPESKERILDWSFTSSLIELAPDNILASF
jgi:hypothetical protein